MESAMGTTQLQAWKSLKLAVDKYSQSTGAEVAVATTYFADTTDNHLSFNQSKPKTTVYGHGSLLYEVRKIVEVPGASMRDQQWIIPEKNVDNADVIHAQQIPINPKLHQQSVSRSLASSFRTLKLDSHPSTLAHGSSGSACITPPSMQDSPAHEIKDKPGTGRRKSKQKKSKKQNLSEDFELDDNLLFDEHDEEPSSDEESEDSDESEEDHRPLRFGRYHAPPSGRMLQQNLLSQDQFATSLPVNINLNWGNRTDASRFRANQGPHPPTFDQSKLVTSGPKIVRADKTPQLDTMMASMQALARSVTDDSALIFGDRPRPRIHDESGFKGNMKF
ncbi:uncharacterized protein LOC100176540 [Ciona intestinalis]